MNVAYISAFAALAGSIIGGLATGITTWVAQRTQSLAGHKDRELERREDIFKEFIIAASRAYGRALVSQEPNIQEIVDLYAIIGRMRVMCSPEIVDYAGEVMHLAIKTLLGPNRELKDILKDGAAIDPLRKFSEMARAELEVYASTFR